MFSALMELFHVRQNKIIENRRKETVLLSKRLASITSFISSFLAVVCPLCIPAFGALLASIGLGFALNFEFLKGLVTALLLISVVSLAWSTRLHKQWVIFFLGLLGALLVYVGRYHWYSLALMLAGASSLIGSSLWNLRAKASCKKCEEAGDKNR